ncbi:putative disease resistance protein RDL5 [Camellia lanceoleosa]|uniref:Disease resistance protein RDL5 n=1 Tax=Camellia lanceoleosa TaxID=1840588 RepID=A0ACC0FXF4_9ERIC|nr:putative disease resistance protein RDL5 [Camellia lanceoleosa]
MATAAVDFLLLNLKQLLMYNADLISGVKQQVVCLHDELSMLKAFLKDSTEKGSEYEIVKQLVRQIRDVVYAAEDAIDTFVVHAAMQRARSTFSKVIHGIDYPTKLRNVTEDIQTSGKRLMTFTRSQRLALESHNGESLLIEACRRKRLRW